jgi:hypothetical protein
MSFRSLPRRIALCLLLGLSLTWLMSEVAFWLLKDSSDHVPQAVELVIPPGTAARVAAGDTPPSIPADLSFVVGDALVVVNQDTRDHQLGPVWVPPGATARLSLNQAERFAYACTFRSSRTFGLDVRPRVTWTTRLQAIFLAGPPMAALLLIYSLVLWPLRRAPTPTG